MRLKKKKKKKSSLTWGVKTKKQKKTSLSEEKKFNPTLKSSGEMVIFEEKSSPTSEAKKKSFIHLRGGEKNKCLLDPNFHAPHENQMVRPLGLHYFVTNGIKNPWYFLIMTND